MPGEDPKLQINSALKPITEKILEFNRNVGKARGTPKRFSEITGYLLIYGRLTQADIQTLTEYSLSNISTSLNFLLNSRIIKKTLIPGTHTFEYFIPNNILKTNIRILEILRGNLINALQFILMIKESLNSISDATLSGYNTLQKQIDFMLHDFQLHESLIQKIMESFRGTMNKQDILDLYKNKDKFHLDVENFNILEVIDPKIAEIESQIIEFFQTKFYSSRDGIARTHILPYFLTRGLLTQNLLKKLTDLSAGAISQGLNELIASDIIEEITHLPSKKGKKAVKIYRIKSIGMAGIKRIYFMFSFIVKWKPIFQDMHNQILILEKSKKNMQNLENIARFINEVIDIFPIYEQFVKIIKEILIQ